MARLIVNADDFGYTAGVNRAVRELYSSGALSSATLMATGAALDDALASLQGGSWSQGLGVGCHVVLVDGAPCLPPEELPTLVRPGVGAGQASFRPSLGGFVADLLWGRIEESEIEREAVAQIQTLQRRGVAVTHLDTHKHTHIFPGVLRPLLRAALACGVKAIRNPFEPAWSLEATTGAPLVRRTEVRLLSLLRPQFARLVAEAGLRTTAGAIGVLATGTLDRPALERLLEAVVRQAPACDPETAWELVCHPGYLDAELLAQSTRLLSAREVERAALAETVPGLQSLPLLDFGEL